MTTIRKKHFSEFFWVCFGQGVSMLGSLALIKLLTQILQPAEYGLLSLVISYGLIVNQLVTGPLSNGMKRFYALADSKNHLLSYYLAGKTLVYKSTYILTFILIIILGIDYFIGFGEWGLLIVMSSLSSFLIGVSAILSSIHSAARKRVSVAFHSMANSFSKLFLVIVFSHFFKLNAINILTIFILVSIFILTSQLFYLRKIIRFDNASDRRIKFWSKSILVYSTPFIYWGLLTWAQQGSDKWSLGYFASSYEVGIYSAIFQIGFVPISVITSLLMEFLEPVFFNYLGRGSDKNKKIFIHETTQRLVIICLFVTILLSSFAYITDDLIVSLFFGDRFVTYSYLFPIFILSGGLFSCGQLITIKILGEMRTNCLLYIKIVTSVLSLILNMFLAKFFGASGVGYAVLIFSAIYFLWVALIGLKLNDLNLTYFKLKD